MSLAAEIEALPSALKARLERRGFSAATLCGWAADRRSDDERNRLTGDVRPVAPGVVSGLPPADSDAFSALRRQGEEALARGELAVCVLAGGMATRMGGVVKALMEVVAGRSFLDLRRHEADALTVTYGATTPLWLMTSEPTEAPIAAALAAGSGAASTQTFEQYVSLRLAADPPSRLWRDGSGAPSVYATGHGDLPDAIRGPGGPLASFVAGGGRHVWISNVDNLGARVDAALLGAHIEAGRPVTVEVVDKREGDTGGGPVRFDERVVICEHFRLPQNFPPASVRVFNTNTFLVDARALLELDHAWTYLRVHKRVADRPAVQFERLLGELTFALPSRYVRVPREGPSSRFVPVKTRADLRLAAPFARALLDRSTPAS